MSLLGDVFEGGNLDTLFTDVGGFLGGGIGGTSSILSNIGSYLGIEDMGDETSDQINDLNTQIYALMTAQQAMSDTLLASASNMESTASQAATIEDITKRPNIDLANTISGFSLTAMMQKYTTPPKMPTISG